VGIRADRHRLDRALVPLQHDRVSRRVFGCQVPEPRRVVIAARSPASGCPG
jgi:hypothetical protein